MRPCSAFGQPLGRGLVQPAIIGALVWLGFAILVDISPTRIHFNAARYVLIPTLPLVLIWLWATLDWRISLAATIAAGTIIRYPIAYFLNFVGARAGLWTQWERPREWF